MHSQFQNLPPQLTAVVCSSKSFEEIIPCLQSLLNQIVPFDSIILVGQQMLGIDRLWLSNFPLLKIFNIEVKGLSLARNFAYQHIHGGYILYVDDDAIYPENFVSQIKEHSKYGLVDVLYLNYIDPQSHQKFRPSKGSESWSSHIRRYASSICILVNFTAPSIEMGFDENFGLGDRTKIKSDEDTDFLLRLINSDAVFEDAPNIISYHSLQKRKYRFDYKARVIGQGASMIILGIKYSGFIFIWSVVLETLMRLVKSVFVFNKEYIKYYMWRMLGFVYGYIFLIQSFFISKFKKIQHGLSEVLRNYEIKKLSLLKITEVTFISNNCTGGHIENDIYGAYTSPFVNMILYPESYVKLANNFDYYVTRQPVVRQFSKLTGFDTSYPVVYLDDVEVHYIHYSINDPVIQIFNERLKRLRPQKCFIPVERDGFTMWHFEQINDLTRCNYFIQNWKFFKGTRFQITIQIPAADVSIGYVYFFTGLLSNLKRISLG